MRPPAPFQKAGFGRDVTFGPGTPSRRCRCSLSLASGSRAGSEMEGDTREGLGPPRRSPRWDGWGAVSAGRGREGAGRQRLQCLAQTQSKNAGDCPDNQD